jgi:hypothetical protein
LNPPEISHRPADADRVAAISRLIRRVCLLREQGDTAEAGELESTALAEAVRAHREASGADSLTDTGLQQLYLLERNRIADAEILCELLVPRLAGAFPAVGRAPPPRRAAAKPVSHREADAMAGSPEIPELLDAMLAAERTGRRVAQNTRPKS